MARQPQRATADQDAKLLQALHDFLRAPKSLGGPIRWKADPPDLVFVVALDIEEVTEPGFQLRGRATLSLPDQDISLHLIRTTLGRKGQNFERLDWRPVHDHRNGRHADPTLDLLHFTASHRHRLVDNAQHRWGLHGAMHHNLPIAAPLGADPPGWPELAALAGRLWNIQGLGDAQAPPWQSDLTALRGRTP